MTDIVINVDEIGSIIAGIITVFLAIYSYLRTKGYIDLWRSKLAIKTDVAQEVQKQNGNALAKLQLSDEILHILQVHASDEMGMIDPDKLSRYL